MVVHFMRVLWLPNSDSSTITSILLIPIACDWKCGWFCYGLVLMVRASISRWNCYSSPLVDLAHGSVPLSPDVEKLVHLEATLQNMLRMEITRVACWRF